MSKIIDNVVLSLFGTDLSGKSYEFVADFTFLWGIFEQRLRIKEGTLLLPRILEVIKSAELKSIFDDRTCFTGMPTQIIVQKTDLDLLISLDNIGFKVSLFPFPIPNDFKHVEKIFNSSLEVVKDDKIKMILLLGIIAYRLRNNLFHGNKAFGMLYEQKSLFDIINTFLSEFMIKTKDSSTFNGLYIG